MTVRNIASSFLPLVVAALLAGCGAEADVPAQAGEAAVDGASTKGVVTLASDEIASLAEEQQVCAVTGEPLGSMGDPVPVRITDKQGAEHTVLLCCESCRKELLAHPDEHLAKLDERLKKSGR